MTTDQRADRRPAAGHCPGRLQPAAPFPAPACPLAGLTAPGTPSDRHRTDVARYVPHETARNARFPIGVVNAAYVGIFRVGQHRVRPSAVRNWRT